MSLQIPIQKDIGEYQPKIIGKMTSRTLISIVGALGASVACGLYLYFVLGLNPGDEKEFVLGWPADSQRIAGEILCVDCQRRTQIALDTAKSGPDAFFWHMGPNF